MKGFWVKRVVDLLEPTDTLEFSEIFKILDKKLTQKDCVNILKIKGEYDND